MIAEVITCKSVSDGSLSLVMEDETTGALSQAVTFGGELEVHVE